jgi:hypothetical protein
MFGSIRFLSTFLSSSWMVFSVGIEAWETRTRLGLRRSRHPAASRRRGSSSSLRNRAAQSPIPHFAGDRRVQPEDKLARPVEEQSFPLRAPGLHEEDGGCLGAGRQEHAFEHLQEELESAADNRGEDVPNVEETLLRETTHDSASVSRSYAQGDRTPAGRIRVVKCLSLRRGGATGSMLV